MESEGQLELEAELELVRQSNLYSDYYRFCPWVVDLFEQKTPWTNFYDAIDQADLDMYSLIDSLKAQGEWPPWRASGGTRSTEITLRLLATIEECLGVCMTDSYVSWSMWASMT